jgi:hypothetical protein
MLHQITEDLAGCSVSDNRSRGNLQANVLAAGSRFVRATPVLAATGTHLAPMMKVEKGIEALLDNQDHVASATAVAAVWPAARYVLLASEGDAAIAAVTGTHGDPY